MIYEYTPIEKNQKDNPFFKMRSRDKEHLKKELEDRLLWLCQLGSSKDQTDKQVYSLVFNIADKKEFGSAPKHNNAANTGAAALAGAIEKLRVGDLSQKQVNYIMPILEVCHKVYPQQWSMIEFKEKNTINVPIDLKTIIEYE
jgi:hypothetical protein